jgi:hypothetical protein
MFYAPIIISGGIGSHFLVLRARTIFRRYRGRLVPISCFARPDFFSAEPRVSHPVFMFSAPQHVFGGTEGVRSRFYFLCSLSRFRRCRGRRVPFSNFSLPNSLSAVPWATGPVFMSCAPELAFGGTEDFGSRFHVFRSRTCFRRNRGSRVPFSCFPLPNSLSAISRASCPVFMFCVP